MDALLPLATRFIFGMNPADIRWVHVVLLGLFALPAIVAPVARVIFHRQRIRFLQEASPEARKAYLEADPKPPGLAGPMLLLALLGVGLVAQAPGRVGPEALTAGVGPQVVQGPMCLADPDQSGTQLGSDSDEESRTCCKGGCEPGSRCNPKSCQCEARAVAPEAEPAGQRVKPTSIKIHTVRAPLEADLADPLDWEPADLAGAQWR